MRDSISAKYSSKPKTSGTLAGQLRVLRELANLRDEDVGRFQGQHPGFVPSKMRSEESWSRGVLRTLEESGNRVVSVPALRIAQTIKERRPDPVLYIRDIVRLVWRGDDSANDCLKILLSGNRIRFDWKRSGLVYEPENDFERAIYRLFCSSSLAKVCGNPDCPAPLFIAQRKSGCYCGEDCAQVYQREWKRNWWQEKGSAKRQRQRAEKRRVKKGGKR
jgi:hypothetical protein